MKTAAHFHKYTAENVLRLWNKCAPKTKICGAFKLTF